MALSPELEAAYHESTRPFVEGGGAITEREAAMRSWRIFLEINSLCSLHCPSCTKGNQAGYDHKTGIMDADMMERILDKIAGENPKARLMLYGNSEPFLHPRLAECIASVKRRGLECEFSTNLNYVHHLDETLAAQPDLIIISLSGFTQEVYEKGHASGKIDKVKANMKLIAEANAQANPPIKILVNFHIYRDNEHELPLMKEYAEGLGLGFFTSYARAISMENSVQYCREHDPESTPFEVQEGRPDWNAAFPPVSQQWNETMNRLYIPPDVAVKMYAHHPIQPVCPIGAGSIFTFIRHDGKVQLCACTADRRITLGNYLDKTPDQMIESRTGHSFCKQCIRYRLNLYFMITDRSKWESPE